MSLEMTLLLAAAGALALPSAVSWRRYVRARGRSDCEAAGQHLHRAVTVTALAGAPLLLALVQPIFATMSLGVAVLSVLCRRRFAHVCRYLARDHDPESYAADASGKPDRNKP